MQSNRKAIGLHRLSSFAIRFATLLYALRPRKVLASGATRQSAFDLAASPFALLRCLALWPRSQWKPIAALLSFAAACSVSLAIGKADQANPLAIEILAKLTFGQSWASRAARSSLGLFASSESSLRGSQATLCKQSSAN